MRRVALAGSIATLGSAWALSSAWAQLPPPPVDGQRVYVNAGCAYCHGNEGEGGWNGERLEGNRRMPDAALVVNMILFGGAFMQGFADELSNEQIAAVANYIRNSWGNSAPPITIEYVATTRGE